MSLWARPAGITRLVLTSILLVAGTSTHMGARAQSSNKLVDFIRFNGAVYLSTAYLDEDIATTSSSPLAPGDLGPVVGEVVTSWVDGNDEVLYPNEPCYWDTPDGTAPLLTPGDDIHAVRGYATTFRIAVAMRATRSPIRSGATTRRRSAPTCLTSLIGWIASALPLTSRNRRASPSSTIARRLHVS